MERIEDIEEFYKKGIEKLDNDFLEQISKIKNIKDREKIGEQYKTNLKALRLTYEKRYILYLKEQKEKIKKDASRKINTKIKIEKIKPFTVEKLDLKPNPKDLSKNIKELNRFKSEIKKREFLEKNIPEILKKEKIIIKLKEKDLSNFLIKLFKRLFLFIKNLTLKILSTLKDSFIFLYTKTKSIILSVINYIKKKTKKAEKKEDKTEKRPDEELAEKILKKSKE
jgi:hypothetical protein